MINSETVSIESIGNILGFGEHLIRFVYTPGHSDASISFTIDSFIFTGDTLIKDECTVTKLPTGSVNKLKGSLELLLSSQGKGYYVLPGHGDCFLLDEYNIRKAL